MLLRRTPARRFALVAIALLAAAPLAHGTSLGPSHGTAAPAVLSPWLAAPAVGAAWLAPLLPGLPAAGDGPAPLPARAIQASPLLCILDTGVDAGHADLDGGKVVAWADFIQDRREPYDDNGHGTHVAGVAAGTGESGAPGAAPYARLAVGKVMDGKGAGTTGAAVRGLDWCVAQGARVINLSLEEKDCAGQRSMADAVARAVRAGALVVTTAGNRGGAECAIHSPGALADAFTVGATDGSSLGAGGIAGFSGRGAPSGPLKPDLVAPGTAIRAAAAGTHLGLRAMDGTSMAAPYVAGVAALLREAHPQATVAGVGAALRHTARDGGPLGPDNAWGWGALDPAAALAWLDARAAAERTAQA